MKKFLSIYLILLSTNMIAQNSPIPERYQRLPFGSIKPSGWLKAQMENDLAGFVGNLDRLVPDLINDPIYGSGRLQKHSKAKDLGNLKEGDAAGDEQYKWWNSETQSNWWDGYIRNALLLNDQQAIDKVKVYINQILATQDEDGYLGIYDTDLRYKFSSENGELWSKATLYRGLLAYYEYTNDTTVWNALIRAIDNVMLNYPIYQSQPFDAGKEFSGGVAHGLTFTDVLDRMYHLTGDRKYLDYAAFLYMNYSDNFSWEKDAQLQNILDPNFKFQSHGAHTYEHMRPLIVAAYTTGNPELQKAVEIYRQRVKNCTTMTGGAIGDEWIGGRWADATSTGYEYCSLHELMDSYALLFQKGGDSHIPDAIENIFYNAAQGSRNPEHSCIAYLKTDNSYEMMGSKNGEIEPGRNQTRYKYSAAHQDVAACCVPNAGRITPYFLQSSWLKEGESTLIAAVLGPNVLQTSIQNTQLKIDVITEYPYQNHFVFKMESEGPISFQLKIRKPEWVKSVSTKEKYNTEDGFLVFERAFSKNDQIELDFDAEVIVTEDINQEKYFSYGAMVFARPIEATEHKGRIYAAGFEDLTYSPLDSNRYEFIQNHNARYHKGKIKLNLRNKSTQKIEKLELIPLGKTILRQTSF
ncbi:MAG: glycoside hydrolase family 127 protein [Bacteroidales bacterium]|nr:glycoside hydrolase family 127 protein [Bacteroidales bacterium]